MTPFRYYLRVRYGECDAQKVVFNARYGEYVDLAVGEFIRAIGLNTSGTYDDFDFQVVKQVTEWRAPARFDQVIEISMRTKHIGNTSFTLFAEFRIAGQEPIVTTIETVYVNVDPKTIVKLPLNEKVRAALTHAAPDVQIDHAGYLQSPR